MSFRGGRGGNRGGRGGHFGGRRDIEEGPPERVVGQRISVLIMHRAWFCHARGGRRPSVQVYQRNGDRRCVAVMLLDSLLQRSCVSREQNKNRQSG